MTMTMNRIKTALFAILVSLAALSGAASEPADRVRQYTYDAAGNITRISSDVYVYDGVSRVISGTVSGRERLYTYDAFGNRRTCWDVGSDSTCQWVAEIASALNRVAGAGYDDGGNLTSYSGQTYAYDSEGMMTSRNLSATEYVYTADDERIAIVTGAAWKWTLRDGSGKVLRELASTAAPDGTHSNWHWTRDNVFRNGILLSTVDPSGTRHYHVDHLGTPRVVSDTNGDVLGVHDYFAFGLELSDNLTEQDPANLRFTGHERDADGLDYMHARFYEPKWGRFLSFDPTWVSADLTAPQTWNRYAYVLNNPVRSFDPTGKWTISIGIGFSLGGGPAGGAKISFNVDDDLNWSVTRPYSFGGGSPAAEINLSGGWSRSDTVDDLVNPNPENADLVIGGGVGVIGEGGVDLGFSRDGLSSLEVGVGFGADVPVDVHAVFEVTPEAMARGSLKIFDIDQIRKAFQQEVQDFLEEVDPSDFLALQESDPDQ